MRSVSFGFLCSAAAMSIAAPAFAASDYLLVIEGVEGEASSAAQVNSWSWGQSNPGAAVAADIGSSGQDGVATRDRAPRVTASQNTQSLRESPTRTRGSLTASQNGQELRQADFASLAKVSEVTGFTLDLGSGAAAQKMCATGKHIAKAHLVRADGTVYDLTDLVIGACDASGGTTRVKIASGKSKEFKGHVTLLK